MLLPLHQPIAPLRTQIVAALRGAIELGELAPGERLIERDLCERLKISRTSFREAVRELVAEKVISQGASRGLVVTQTTLTDARSVYSVRSAIQGLIVEEFVEVAQDLHREAFYAASASLEAAYEQGVVAQILDSKRAFYAALCAGAANTIALEIIEQLCLRVAYWRRQASGRTERNQASKAEIEQITRWIRLRDAAKAREAMVHHVRSVERWALGEARCG